MCDRGGGLRGASRRRRDHPPRAGGRPRGRIAKLSPPARADRSRRQRSAGRYRISGRRQIRSLAAPSTAAIRARGVTAFVTVQEGCDKFCSFCVVPYTRGAETSRPVEKIAAEVERLAAAGVREITLIGQNVNAYHGAGPDGRPWSLARCSNGWRTARRRAAPLHHQPSARHGRRPDCGASRFAGADAAIAFAGAIGLRPDSRCHEPPP